MNRRRLGSIVLVLVAIPSVLWWIMHPAEEMGPTQQVVSARGTVDVTNRVPQQFSPADSMAARDLQIAVNKQELQKREQQTTDAFNASIDFFGKVVDEHGVPIPGASTSFVVTTRSLMGNPTQKGPKTDSAGLFSITGKRGPRLAVIVEHPDYYKTEQHGSFFTHGGILPNDSPKLPTADNPRIFVLQKKGKPATLFHRSIKLRVPMNGTPTRLELGPEVGARSEFVNLVLKSEGEKVPLNHYYPFEWTLTIYATGGGGLRWRPGCLSGDPDA